MSRPRPLSPLRAGPPRDQGGWNVIGGTGAYAGLQGGGNLVAVYTDTGIIDHYTGVVTN